MEIALVGYVFLLATKVRAMETARGKRFFWLNSIFRLLCLSFGGGTVVPIVLGMRPFPFANDAALTATLVVWWCVHYFPGDLVFKAYKQSTTLRCLVAFLFEVMRGNVILVWLTQAHNVIPAGKYYAVPVWGPILCGSLAGCFGGFLHGGFGAVEKEVSWLVQSALYAAAYFHFAVYDPNVSPVLSSLSPFGSGAAEEWRVVSHVSVVAFLAATAVAQEFLGDKDFNPFKPLHSAAYIALGVPK